MKIYLGKPAVAGGIARVYDGLYKYLPLYDHEIVETLQQAELVHAHINTFDTIPLDTPLVVSSHGMLWHDDEWQRIGAVSNNLSIESYLQADVVTAPSDFVAHAIQRHTAIGPLVVRHGIDASEWEPVPPKNYVLWNKARRDPANDPTVLNQLAQHFTSLSFVSTFGNPASNVKIIGNIPYETMQTYTSEALVYFDTPRESGGPCFGVLEAMAAGVPTLAWNNGGNREAIVHKETGWLANSYNELIEGLHYCIEHRNRLGQNARQLVQEKYTWEQSIEGYIQAYELAQKKVNTPVDVSIIIPCYNLGEYVHRAIESAMAQTHKSVEVIVVDDASTDNSSEVISRYNATHLTNKDNLHVADSRNKAIRYAKGRFILPLDADDWLEPNAVELLLGEMDRKTHIVTGKLLLHHNVEQAYKGEWPDAIEYEKHLKGGNILPYCSMYQRKVWENLGGYRRRIRNGTEDVDFWTRAFAYGYSASLINQAHLHYLWRQGSLGKQARDANGDWLNWYGWHYAEQNAPAGNLYDLPREVAHYDEPSVSVVIPVGPGHLPYIQTCVDSLHAQTLKNWEAIVVNDTGRSWENSPYIMGIQARLIDSNENRGVAHARNVGIQHAKAKHIVFLDVDDIAQPDMLSLLYHTENCGWGYGDWYYNKDGKRIRENAPEWDTDLFLSQQLAPITGIYKREDLLKVGGFDEDAPGWEDWDLLLSLKKLGLCGTRIPVPLITYHMDAGWRREENFKNQKTVLEYINEKHKQLFERTIDMGCRKCSKKKNTTTSEPVMNVEEVWVVRVTDKMGKTTYAPPRTGRRYSVTPHKPLKINPEDESYFLQYPEFQRIKQEAPPVVEAVISAPEIMRQETFSPPIEQSGLSKGLITTLKKGGFDTVEDLLAATDAEILAVKGVGQKLLKQYKEEMYGV